jgi:hypothetical protein
MCGISEYKTLGNDSDNMSYSLLHLAPSANSPNTNAPSSAGFVKSYLDASLIISKSKST